LAVYAGCACPTAPPLACSDDDCARGSENLQSRLEFGVTQGARYLVRVGGYALEQGNGTLNIGCNLDACATGAGDCFVASPTGAPGCGDPDCCNDTCAVDPFCCDVQWDAECAGLAKGACTGGFSACGGRRTGPCGVPDNDPGCEDVTCCNAVCFQDPYCCVEEWDSTCANEANSICFLTCAPTAGGCFTAHPTPGCNVDSCCRLVCTQDPTCCDTNWDAGCVSLATAVCP
jgi:hypothetical protein